MSYKFCEIHLGRITNSTDLLKKPIEIYKAFIRRAGRSISSSNFNKYTEVTAASNLKIEIRIMSSTREP